MLVKIYTKTGDNGTTGLIGGKRIKKSSSRIAAYGTIDELNAAIGLILSAKLDSDIHDLLTQIQNDLFLVGADLANPSLDNNINRVTPSMIAFLEKQIDGLENDLPTINYFILPGGDLVASQVHLARAICRRAETHIVELADINAINKNCQIYINRLSDLLFVIARVINKRKKIKDIPWKK